MRFGNPRRANARRSWKRAFVQRECRFLQRTNVVQPRAGGVSPPVEKHLFRRPESHICNSVRRRNQRRMACASRGERIESADAIRMCAGRVHERSDVPVEFAAGIPIIRLALAFLTRSGERKPPVGHIRRCESETHIARDMSRMQPRAGGRKRSVGCTPHARSKRRNSSRSTCRCGSESHGGLTPAALVNVRLCSANVVFRRETRYALRLPFSPASRHRATRSGGRKPPVEKHLFRRPESHICNSVRRRNQERGA
jgi:hypothetical protein